MYNVYIKTNQRGHGNIVQKCIDIKSNTCFNIWFFFNEKQVNTGVMYGSATVMAPVKNCANTSPAVK